MVTNEIQRTILSNCSFYPKGAKYSEMRTPEMNIENDLYNYHLQQLVNKGLLQKEDQLYLLTTSGKSIVTNIDEVSKTLNVNYKVSVYICPVVENKVLLCKRLKHPQYGYTGLISGKMKFGENIISTAKRELLEETNLTADFKIVGNLHQIRKDRTGNVIEDGIFYVCYTDKVDGSMVENKEGSYFWVDISTISSIEKIFKPSLEIVIDEIQQRRKGTVKWTSQFIYELEPEPEDY